MTTKVKIEHDGGNHAVIVELNDKRVAALKTRGDNHVNNVYQQQSFVVREATDAEETELRGPSGPVTQP